MALYGLMSKLSIFSYKTTTTEANKTNTYTFFCLCLASWRIKADLVLLKMEPICSPQNFPIDCPCLQPPFIWGQVLLLECSSRCCGKLSHQHLLGVWRCFLSYLFLNGLLGILKQMRSVKFFTSQQCNLLKLTINI